MFSIVFAICMLCRHCKLLHCVVNLSKTILIVTVHANKQFTLRYMNLYLNLRNVNGRVQISTYTCDI